MSNPPGVRVIPTAIQKPPYEDRAVAPKVFPTAISLVCISFSVVSGQFFMNAPHASKQLDKTAVAVSRRNDNVGHGNTASLKVDEGQEERGQGESAETKWRGVGELAVADISEQTRLEFTTKGRVSTSFGGNMGQRTVAKCGCPLRSLVLLVRHVGRVLVQCSGASMHLSVALLVRVIAAAGVLGSHFCCFVLV